MNYEELLENEIAILRDLASRSIDPLVVAKSVAAADPSVKQLILKRLNAGQRLAETFSFSGTSRTELKVFFRFIPSGEQIRLVDSGILVFVDITRGEMLGTLDPYRLQPEEHIARPFVSISPPDTSKFIATDDEISEIKERQNSFFQKLGSSSGDIFGGGGFGGGGAGGSFNVATVIDTIFGTETWSGTPRVSDDTRSDRTDDYMDSTA
ncbi:MAG: hypothetical protein L0H53_07280 [Candidatus Nitrosocosmicus sp.]|nr:hypothetical protein [Candidatus Nitrosocosmicus sp.]